MKKTILLAALVGFAVARFACGQQQSFGVSARYHMQHEYLEDTPYEDGDMSYGLMYEYHDGNGLWQIGVRYSPEVGGTNALDGVITPELNLVIKDNFWRGGLGIFANYLQYEEGDNEWTDIAWQVLLGIELPIGALPLEIYAVYPFENWSDFNDFDFDDVEYAACLSFRF